jgi:hypothetical protein
MPKTKAVLFLLGSVFAGLAAGPVGAASLDDPMYDGESAIHAPYPVPAPTIEDLRGIQYEYSSQANLVVVEWKIVNGPFDEIQVSLGDASSRLAGNATGISFRNVAPGSHDIRVEGTFQETVIFEEIPFTVLRACPVAPVTVWNCLYYGNDTITGKGFLQIAWDAPLPPPGDSFVEYEISMDGKFLLLTRTTDGAVTVYGTYEGNHTVGIIGITRSYAAPETRKTFHAEKLPPPEDLSLMVNCNGTEPLGKIDYRIPEEVGHDAIAVWIRSGGPWEFRGYFTAPLDDGPGDNGPAIYVPDLPDGLVDIEASLVLFDEDRETPRAMSNLPGKPGAHAILREVIDCRNPIEFLRGDADSNGRVNITDGIRLLSYLFIGISSISCPVSADVDDNDLLEITDGIGILNYLFMGGSDPEPPGPWTCGQDPTPGELWECAGGTCNS